ncbi:MAG: HEAT repeat domain-containing protein, partial [Verrucomicrobiae bacterium]|nr:HEAT repeat domain-containing protein [Verrucomicrobiae bacterium]NNJ86213.1 PDZ domain-containing protein [Akkermansiaceae bacterium]
MKAPPNTSLKKQILSNMIKSSLILFALAILPLAEALPPKSIPNPDFTKGDAIPEGATHDWNLGATGLRGWIYSQKLSTAKARQIKVTHVAPGSPADGVIHEGDVILGLDGKPFSYDPRIEFGRALSIAEAGDGKLALTIWRDGKSREVTIPLQVLGAYSPTAPYDCPKSERILELGCDALAKRMKEPKYRMGAIPRSLNALALLASGNPKYLPLVKREAGWASHYKSKGMATWYYGYVIMLLAEYHMVTQDDSVLPGLERLALEAARGQSIVGSWGHGFALSDGRLGGYGMMNAPGVPLTISLVMARGAGIDHPDVANAIERSAKLLRFYEGKGSVPYGDHAPWTQTHEGNGKTGMAGVLFNLMEEKKPAKFFSRMALASHGPERDTGHTGNFWNMTWAMPAVNLSGPHGTGAWMKEFGAWYYDLARGWDGTFLHQGPPQPGPDKTRGWDASGSYLLAYAMPLKKIWLTGAKKGGLAPLSAEEAQSIVNLGKGWSNADRNSFYDKLSKEELFERLGVWSPVVRKRAAAALVRRNEVSMDALIDMLGSDDLYQRLGACDVLAQLKSKAAKAVPVLIETLDAKEMWLRVQAAEALGSMGKAGMPALPKLLEIITVGPTKEDPRAMEQRFLTTIVFKNMLRRHSLEGVDRKKLFAAVRSGLKNDDGRSRSAIGSIYNKLSYEQIKPLLPAVYEAVVVPSPSGIMFSDGIRISGLKVLAKHRIKEGIPL